ncbi:MAG: GYD domain-containing protein [Planctomycetaceae bacterium]
MVRYVLLLQFTEQGAASVKGSTQRAEEFRQGVAAAGGKVEFLSWTLGHVDGVVVFTAPDETTAVSLVLELRKHDMVQTTMLRAFGPSEFDAIVAKMS